MKFRLTKASNWGFSEEEIEIDSLEDLESLQDLYTNCEGAPDWAWKEPALVVDFNKREITIYDYYLE